MTLTELAANLGVGQAQISKIERQSDMLLSTLDWGEGDRGPV